MKDSAQDGPLSLLLTRLLLLVLRPPPPPTTTPLYFIASYEHY